MLNGRIFLSILFACKYNFLKQKPCPEPERGIVQANDPLNIPATFAVIPGTEAAAGQKSAADVLSGKNKGHIGKSTHPKGLVLEQTK